MVRDSPERSLPTTSVVEEVLQLVPPRPPFRGRDLSPVKVPWESLSAFALRPNGVAASYVRTMLRWAEVPECLISIQQSVGAEFMVTTSGPRGVSARWWVSGDAGWVGLGLEAGEVVMAPSSLDDIREALLVDLVEALTATAA